MVLAFSEGLHLHLSHARASGYLNIKTRRGGAGFVINDPTVPGYDKYQYPTALAAAVAYARMIGGAALPEESGGFNLHKSNRSKTGYRGVIYTPYAGNGRLRSKPWRATLKIGGKIAWQQHYPTAVQAAVAWARALAGGWPRHPYFQST